MAYACIAPEKKQRRNGEKIPTNLENLMLFGGQKISKNWPKTRLHMLKPTEKERVLISEMRKPEKETRQDIMWLLKCAQFARYKAISAFIAKSI